jgi:heptose I phosphotransferase
MTHPMPTFPLPLLLPAVCCLLVGVGGLAWRRYGRRRRRGWLAVQPQYHGLLRRLGLTDAERFLALPAVIVSGHPDRNVSVVTLGEGGCLRAYLKREHRVPWTCRLANALAGFGFVSRSLREAHSLQALRHEGIACPEWMAVGEDGRGRAFLLVRAAEGAVEMRTYLQGRPAARDRLRLARRLGAALARMHGAGFLHPDLYAKHVLVGPGGRSVVLLDWQRSRRRHPPSPAECARDLAALHATLAGDLASPRERLACLVAYARRRPALRSSRRALRRLLRRVAAEARRLLARRHIREKQQPALPPDAVQDWVRLEGEALCVTSAVRRIWPAPALQELSLDRQPAAPGAVARRWLAPPGAPRALLVRRFCRRPLALLWSWLRGKPLASPERRQAALLLRLQRHAVAAPRVLAMGQRRTGAWGLDSFLLTEPPADAVRLDAWLAGQAGDFPAWPAALRRHLLRDAGALLRRLHRASCYLGPGGALGTLAVQFPAGAAPAVVLGEVDAVRVTRRHRPDLARQGVADVRNDLAAAGCGRADWRCFLAGYRTPAPSSATGPARRVTRPDKGGGGMGIRNAQAAAWREEGGRRRMEVTATPPAPAAKAPAEGGQSLWRRLAGGVRRLRQRADWAAFAGADWADRIMGVAVTDRFHAKQGRSTGRWVLDLPVPPGEPARRLTVYLKRHYELPWWQGWLAALWPRGDWSPAMQEWRHLEWARRQGLPVPRAVAAAEYLGPWGRLQSFLAVEELADMVPLNEAIPLAAARLDPPTYRRWKQGLLAEMARLARLLHDRRCFHKDLYLCHFYVARGDTQGVPAWRGRVYLIDLHRLARHSWTWRLWQVKDLAQLLYSSEVAGVTARDRLAFWRAYRHAGPRRASDRWLRRWIVLKWRRYRRHNARRKAAGLEEAGPVVDRAADRP